LREIENYPPLESSPYSGIGAGSAVMKKSAGTLLYRRGPNGLEVLIVHPSGNYNAKAPWTLPKGIPEDVE
jgi:hypothetical protein